MHVIQKLLIKVSIGQDWKRIRELNREEQCCTKIQKEKFKAFQLKKKLYIQLILDTMCTTDRAVKNKYIYKAFFSWLISTSISENNPLK